MNRLRPPPPQVRLDASDWRALRPLEPALAALHPATGTPVTARLSWWRSVVMADPGTVPVLATLPGPGGTLRKAAALIALRDQDGGWQITSGRPHSDDVWEVAAVIGRRPPGTAGGTGPVSPGNSSRSWRLTLTGLRNGEDARVARRAASGRPRGTRATRSRVSPSAAMRSRSRPASAAASTGPGTGSVGTR